VLTNEKQLVPDVHGSSAFTVLSAWSASTSLMVVLPEVQVDRACNDTPIVLSRLSRRGLQYPRRCASSAVLRGGTSASDIGRCAIIRFRVVVSVGRPAVRDALHHCTSPPSRH
jgi:hypothetical protein